MQYVQKCTILHCVLWAEQFSCTEKHTVCDEFKCYINICCFWEISQKIVDIGFILKVLG